MNRQNFKDLFRSIGDLFDFVILITLYGLYKVIGTISLRVFKRTSPLPLFTKLYTRLIKVLDKERVGSISRVNLIELSLKNMADKKTRTRITMGGMALGIGLIVLLVSIGYGLEQLVVNRVARLEELKQADVIPGLSQELYLSDKSLSMFKQIHGVVEAIPVISAVGEINYNNSQSNMAVYGVTSRYLLESAIHPTSGKIFDSNELITETTTVQDLDNSVAPASDTTSDHSVTYTLDQGTWYRVRESADAQAMIIGYTRFVEPDQVGVEVSGGDYAWQNGTQSNWLQADFLLWDKSDCAGQTACEDGQYLPQLVDSAQVRKKGNVAVINIEITRPEQSRVIHSEAPAILGEISDGSLPVVEIATLSGTPQSTDVKTRAVGGRAVKEVVVNTSALRVLNLDEQRAVGQKIKLSFVVVGTGHESSAVKTQSLETEYTIIGIIPDDTTPVMYIPFIDLRSLGVDNYSQVKIICEDTKILSSVRTSIESMGYGTLSVTDTVGQIDKLFTSLRTFLAALGVVALAVASLGMFNTLTVSLLERTHEVGLMKAIGMKSSEVKELFLTESMIMGFFGGILGLLLGIFAGFVISVILSLVAITKGVGFLNVTHIPLPFAILIIFVSLIVGVGTGYVPARRATRISALDALRYE